MSNDEIDGGSLWLPRENLGQRRQPGEQGLCTKVSPTQAWTKNIAKNKNKIDVISCELYRSARFMGVQGREKLL